MTGSSGYKRPISEIQEVALIALQLRRFGLKWYQVHKKLQDRGLIPTRSNMVGIDIYTTAVNELRADIVRTPSRELLQLFLLGGLEEIVPPSHEGRSWTAEEENTLKEALKIGWWPSQMASVMGRTPYGIVARAVKMGLIAQIGREYVYTTPYCTIDELRRMQERYKKGKTNEPL